MKFTMEENNNEFLTLPDDAVIQVMVEEIELRPVPPSNGREGWNKLNFRFKILGLPSKLEDEYAVIIGSTIYGGVSARFTEHPDNKLRKWAEALLDIGELEPGFELDTDMLVGRKARAVISTYPKKDGTGRNHSVFALLPSAGLGAGLGSVSLATGLVDEDAPPF